MNELGIKVDSSELQGYFSAPEGSIQMIYGRIRQGKSTYSVRGMLDRLERGSVEYSNILLDLSSFEFDERMRFSDSFWSLLMPKKYVRFYKFDKNNYRYFDPTTGLMYVAGDLSKPIQVFNPEIKGAEIEWLNSLTDCTITYDEGQWLLDSYEATYASVAKRKLITESGHVGRTIIVVAQRTQSVHVNARGNVNQFFRCKKRSLLFWSVLIVEEFQGMKGQDVDEDAEPDSIQRFWNNKKAWRAFNTHYLRAGRLKSQDVHFFAYDLDFPARFIAMTRNVKRMLSPALRRGQHSRVQSEIQTLGVKPSVASIKIPMGTSKGRIEGVVPTPSGSIQHRDDDITPLFPVKSSDEEAYFKGEIPF